MDTINAMANNRRKHLEGELVRIARELSEHTSSPSYAVPYKTDSGRIQYVAVGTRNSIHAFLQRALVADKALKAKTKGGKG
jgi:hypothetical protein